MSEQRSDDSIMQPSIQPPLLDLLMAVLDLLVGEDAFDILEALHIQCFSCLLDTNVLLKDIGYAVRRHERTALVRAAQTGIVRLYASTTVRNEVPEKIPLKCRELHFDKDVGMAVWEQVYVPLITFLDTEGLHMLSQEMTTLRMRDTDDVPTGQLALLLQPTAIFSEDQALETFTTVADSIRTQLSSALRDYAERDLALVAISFGGGTVIQISLSLLRGLLQLVLTMNRKLLAVLGIALAIALVIPRSRRFLIEHGRALLDLLFSEQVCAFLQDVGVFVLESYEMKRAAGEFIAQHERTLLRPKKTLEYMTLVLSRTPAPMRVRRIVEAMNDFGCMSRSAYPERYVGHLLRTHPNLFEKVAPGQWRLRSHSPEVRHFAGEDAS